jgi:hypothetical protein
MIAVMSIMAVPHRVPGNATNYAADDRSRRTANNCPGYCADTDAHCGRILCHRQRGYCDKSRAENHTSKKLTHGNSFRLNVTAIIVAPKSSSIGSRVF